MTNPVFAPETCGYSFEVILDVSINRSSIIGMDSVKPVR